MTLLFVQFQTANRPSTEKVLSPATFGIPGGIRVRNRHDTFGIPDPHVQDTFATICKLNLWNFVSAATISTSTAEITEDGNLCSLCDQFPFCVVHYVKFMIPKECTYTRFPTRSFAMFMYS